MPSNISISRKLSYTKKNKMEKFGKHNNYGAFTPLFYRLRGDKVAVVAACSNMYHLNTYFIYM